MCHRSSDCLRRLRQYWATSLLCESRSKGCGDFLPHSRKSMFGNRIRITKVVPLLPGLWDMLDDEVPCNKSSSSAANSPWEDILVVATIITILLEGRNTQGSKKSGHSRFPSIIPEGRGIPVGWWSSRGSAHDKSNWRARGDEVWWLVYGQLGRHRNSSLSRRRKRPSYFRSS